MHQGSFNRYDANSSYRNLPVYPTRSYHFQNMQKSTQLSQTDKRIEEIKKKYDTPNRRERLSQLSGKKSDLLNKQNDNYGTAEFKTKSFLYSATQDTNDNCLKQSKTYNANNRASMYQNTLNNPKSSLLSNKLQNHKDQDPQNYGHRLYKNQNQQQFFKRVKQMKESLLYSDKDFNSKNNDTSGYGVSKNNKDSRAKLSMYESNQTVEKQRIDNIDKINQKIKGILQCLNENQKGRMNSKYSDLNNKRSRVDSIQTSNIDLQYNNNKSRQITRTPIKSVFTSSMMGKSTYMMTNNHRHDKSQLLQKIEINKNSNEKRKQHNDNDNEDDKWQKLSSKLQKYEIENKLRIQKALQLSKASLVDESQNKIIKPEKQIQRKSYIEPKFNHQRESSSSSVDFAALRSRSFITPHLTKQIRDRDHSLHMRQTTQTKYEMRSGKKLDDEITKIQKKIQQFEEEKKRLNINFKPFTFSNSKSTSNLGIRALSNLNSDYSQRKDHQQATKSLYKYNNPDRSLIIKDVSKEIDKRQQRQVQSTFRERSFHRETFGTLNKKDNEQKLQYSFEGLEQSKNNVNEDRLNRHIQIKIQKSNPSSVKTSKFISQNSSRVSQQQNSNDQSYAVQQQTKQQIQIKSANRSKQAQNYIFNDNLKRQTDEGIQERRKRLQNNSTNNETIRNGELKKLVRELCQQVRLDEQFRNAKIWFEYNMNPQKEVQMRKYLPDKSIQQIHEILKVRQSQNNPFFTAQGFESSFQHVAELYKLSEEHWRQKLYKQFEKQTLQLQGFTEKQLDLDKKNHISLGDLVRFLNLQSGTFYRNRDIALIFIRICQTYGCDSYTQLSFKYILQAFSQ